MDYRILFTQRALSDLSEIVGHIAEDDEEVASRFGEALLDHVDLLRLFPPMASTVRKRSRLRKLVHSPVIVCYEVHEAKRPIEILHFRHGSRKPPRL